MSIQQEKIIKHICTWLKEYSDQSKTNGFIIGISGGIDSAVTSTLCALTGKQLICLNLPIHQKAIQNTRANNHIAWLQGKFQNIQSYTIDLSESFETFKKSIPENSANHNLSMANTRARLRMTTLYAIGQANGLLVAGTGNKIEDFGVGFFTKYGDGGVDLSPIADLTKTEVFSLGRELGIIEEILTAKPTDGLWEDDRSDEEQLGASYPDLEWAMNYIEEFGIEGNHSTTSIKEEFLSNLNAEQKKVIGIYLKFHNINKHKMTGIPVCLIPEELKK